MTNLSDVLRQELGDPKYQGKDAKQIAVLLTTQDITLIRDTLLAQEIFSNIDSEDWAGLSDLAVLSKLQILLALPGAIPLTPDSAAWATLTQVGDKTIARFEEGRKRVVSRAEQLGISLPFDPLVQLILETLAALAKDG